MNYEDFLNELKWLNENNIGEDETLNCFFEKVSPKSEYDSLLEGKFNKKLRESEIKDEYLKYCALATYYNVSLKTALQNGWNIIDNEDHISIEKKYDNKIQNGYSDDYVEAIYGIRKCIEKYPELFDEFKESFLEGLIEKHKNELLSNRRTNKRKNQRRLSEASEIYYDTKKNKFNSQRKVRTDFITTPKKNNYDSSVLFKTIEKILKTNINSESKINNLEALKQIQTENFPKNREIIESIIDEIILQIKKRPSELDLMKEADRIIKEVKVKTIKNQDKKERKIQPKISKKYFNSTGISPFESWGIEDIIEAKDYILNNQIATDATCSEEYQELQRLAQQYVATVGIQLEQSEDQGKLLNKIDQQQKDLIDKIKERKSITSEDPLYPFRRLFILNMLERVTSRGKRVLSTPKDIPELDMTTFNIEEIKKKETVELTGQERRKMEILYRGILEVLVNETLESYKKIKKLEIEKVKRKI